MQNSEYIVTSSGRLDGVLSDLSGLSRAKAAQAIKAGGVRVDGAVVQKSSSVAQCGSKIDLRIKSEPVTQERAKPLLEITKLYEDDEILIIDKPSGLVVHPAPSVREYTLACWLRDQNIPLSTLAGEGRDGIVHRIDKETSGALVIAKTDRAYESLKSQLLDKSMGRIYLAVIDAPLKEDCIVEKPLARNPKNRLKISVQKVGREAKSAFVKILDGKNGKMQLIGAKLFTGRTHQIRVHLASLGRHIAGDDLYGFKSQNATIQAQRVMLHAYRLYLFHPTTSQPVSVVAPLPDDFLRYATNFFDEKELHESITSTSLDDRFTAFD